MAEGQHNRLASSHTNTTNVPIQNAATSGVYVFKVIYPASCERQWRCKPVPYAYWSIIFRRTLKKFGPSSTRSSINDSNQSFTSRNEFRAHQSMRNGLTFPKMCVVFHVWSKRNGHDTFRNRKIYSSYYVILLYSAPVVEGISFLKINRFRNISGIITCIFCAVYIVDRTGVKYKLITGASVQMQLQLNMLIEDIDTINFSNKS